MSEWITPVVFSIDTATSLSKTNAVGERMGPAAQEIWTARDRLFAQAMTRLREVQDDPDTFEMLRASYEALGERVRLAADYIKGPLLRLSETLPELRAPWQLADLGDQAVAELAPRTQLFVTNLDPADLRSTHTWKGSGATAFTDYHAAQRQAAEQTARVSGEFAQHLVDYATNAIAVTDAFLVAAAQQLAIIAESAGPLGTIEGAADAASRIVGAGRVLDAAIEVVKARSSQLASDAASTLTGSADAGRWPLPN